MNVVPVVRYERPVSAWERARAYVPPRPTVRRTSVIDGELYALKRHLEAFETRLNEPRVGDLLRTSMATQGHLYDVRRELQDRY